MERILDREALYMLHPGNSAFLVWGRGVKRGGYLLETRLSNCVSWNLEAPQRPPPETDREVKVKSYLWAVCSPNPVPTPSTAVPLTPILSTRLLCDFNLTMDFAFFKSIKTPPGGHLQPWALLYLHSQQSADEETGCPCFVNYRGACKF